MESNFTSQNRNIDTKVYQSIRIFMYYWEFTNGLVQGKPNIDRYFLEEVEVGNGTKSKSLIMVYTWCPAAMLVVKNKSNSLLWELNNKNAPF